MGIILLRAMMTVERGSYHLSKAMASLSSVSEVTLSMQEAKLQVLEAQVHVHAAMPEVRSLLEKLRAPQKSEVTHMCLTNSLVNQATFREHACMLMCVHRIQSGSRDYE